MTASPAPISAADREKAPLPRILLSEDRKRLKKVAENAFRDGDEAGKPERKRFAGVKATELLALVNDAEVAATARARVVELEAALKSERAHWLEASGLAEASEARATALLEALTLALQRLERTEPTDSRAISAEFVSMAAVLSGVDDEGHHKLIRAAINAGASYDRK